MRRRLAAFWARRNLPTRAAVVASTATGVALLLVVGFITAIVIFNDNRLFDPDQDKDLFDATARANIARVDPDRYDFTGLGSPDRVTMVVRARFERTIIAQAKVTDLTDATLARPQWRRAVALVARDQARVELVSTGDSRRPLAFLAVSAVVTLLLVGLATWLAVGRTLRSVAAIREQVDLIGAEQLHRRVPVPPARDEIARLAETMNRMLDRLAESSARQRRFIADASHELRTPVTAVKATAEVALAHPSLDAREVLGEVYSEAGRLEALVADLLDLARLADTTTPRRDVPVDLDDIVLRELSTLRLLHPEVLVDANRVSAARVDGRATDLARMTRNLLVNAARHGGSRIAVTLEQRGGQVRLAVDDDGRGIAPSDHDRIFEPFVRIDDGRDRQSGGTGLGLALVRAVAQAHRGTATVTHGTLGGARFVVLLPASPLRAAGVPRQAGTHRLPGPPSGPPQVHVAVPPRADARSTGHDE